MSCLSASVCVCMCVRRAPSVLIVSHTQTPPLSLSLSLSSWRKLGSGSYQQSQLLIVNMVIILPLKSMNQAD